LVELSALLWQFAAHGAAILEWAIKPSQTKSVAVSAVSTKPASRTVTSPPGRPKKLDDRTIRRVIRRASEGSTSSSRLKADFDLPVAARTIRRILEETDFLVFSKMEQTIELTAEHKAKRLAFAKLHLESGTDWKGTFFSKVTALMVLSFLGRTCDVIQRNTINISWAVGVSCFGSRFVGKL
jgi:hypothetical protein